MWRHYLRMDCEYGFCIRRMPSGNHATHARRSESLRLRSAQARANQQSVIAGGVNNVFSNEDKMSEAKRASDTPFGVEVEAGKTYFWCACGRSQNQPFCDGSHKDTGFTPVKYAATESKKVFFCGCKSTASQPLCDGSHNKPV